MEINELLLGFILLIVALFFLIALIKPELLETATKKTTFPGVIEIFGEPEIAIDPKDLSGAYEYRINFKAHIEYKGEFSRFGERIGFIDVVPLISYKGKEQKAFAEDDLGQPKPYLRIKEDRTYNKAINSNVVSKEPPMQKMKNPYTGEMIKGEIFLMEDIGQFLVKLDSVESTVLEDFFCHEFPVVGRACESTCWAFLRVECIHKSKKETKLERLRGECKEDASECEQEIKCSDGSVYVNVKKTDCDKDKAELEISAEGGKSSEEDSKEKLGEDFEISFWLKSECVDKENRYENLRVKCDNAYLGGPYKFKYVSPQIA